MFKRVISICMAFVIFLSIAAPFASAAEDETRAVQYYSYNGIVIPDISEIWDKANFPYVLVKQSGSYPVVYFSSKPFSYYSSSDSVVGDRPKYRSLSLKGTDKDFIELGVVQWNLSNTFDAGFTAFVKPANTVVFWCNHDIYGYDDPDTLYYPTSEPVIDKLVHYNTSVLPAAPRSDYGGIVVPNISSCDDYDLSKYPYCLLYTESSGEITLLLSDVPFLYRLDYGYIRMSVTGNLVTVKRTSAYFVNGYGWDSGELKSTSGSMLFKVANGLFWSNCDIYDTDGNLFYTSVPAVPVDPPDVGGGDSGGGENVEVTDITFFNNILRLFTVTFDAASGDEYFRFLIYFVVVEVAFGLFFFLTKGSKKF